MVIPAPGSAPLAFHNTDGRVVLYLVPAEEYDRLRAEVESLRAGVEMLQAERDTLRRQKDHYVAELTEVLKTTIPIPPSEEELLTAVDNSAAVRKIIEDLESR